MKKESKSNLDEMKEQQLLHIERNGCWLAFWGLFIAQGIQFVMNGDNMMRNVAGEWIVFMLLALYLAIACIRRGIWDRKLKPNFATNLVVSLIAGVVCFTIFFGKSYRDYGSMAGAIATGVIMFIAVTGCCLVGLVFMSKVYKLKNKKLEEAEDITESEADKKY